MPIYMKKPPANMHQPRTIPFNIIDRSYLIPETTDLAGTHFPMSIITVLRLEHPPTKDDVIAALQRLAQHFPQLRLGYQLNPVKSRWERVPHENLADYLAACVSCIETQTIEIVVSNLIRANNEPFIHPLNIILCGDYLLIRMHHSFGDGQFLFRLNQYLLTALLHPEQLTNLPKFSGWRFPVWKLIWRDLQTARTVFTQWLRTITGAVNEFQQQMSDDNKPKERTPIVSGAPQQVIFRQITMDSMNIIQKIRDKLSQKQRISLNTLIQILIAQRLSELGLLQLATTYSIPVDLHRYLKNPDELYPGNLATQIRIPLPAIDNWVERCYQLQERIDKQLDSAIPLVGLPGEWLLALAGDKTYKSVNRDWLMKSTNTDTRFFVMSNLGNLDNILGKFSEKIQQPNVVIPLTGAPPLVLSLNTYQGQGNIAITYDPRVLEPSQVEDFCMMFESEWLSTKLATVS
jgi:NRPS condensation-like uncharacterized protein